MTSNVKYREMGTKFWYRMKNVGHIVPGA